MTEATPLKHRPRLELCWGTLGLTSFEDLVDAAGQAGFDAVTVPSSGCEPFVRDQRRTRALRQRMTDAGTVITVVDPLVNGLPGLRGRDAMPQAYRALLDSTAADCASFAIALGATTVNIAQVTGGPTPLDQLCDAVAGFTTTLGERGVRAALEFIPGTGIPDLATASAIMTAVNAPNLGITFDTWHFNRAGGEPHDLADLQPGCIFALQINDSRDLASGGPHVPGAERLLPGEGRIPLVDLLGRLLRTQPDLYVGVEVFSDDLRQLGARRAAVEAFVAASRVLDSVMVVELHP
jgi:sugar phosphate isomerase/epimerase